MKDNQMQALRKAYCAGLIDGEGCFQIRKMESKKSLDLTNRKNPVFYASLGVRMSTPEPLQFLKETFPACTLRYEGVRKDRPTNRPLWVVTVQRKDSLLALCLELKEFLVLKRPHAELILEFLNTWENPYNRKTGLSEFELNRREWFCRKMRELNTYKAAATTKPCDILKDEAIV